MNGSLCTFLKESVHSPKIAMSEQVDWWSVGDEIAKQLGIPIAGELDGLRVAALDAVEEDVVMK